MRITHPTVPMHTRPASDAPMSSELLFGETVDALETLDDWARVRAHADGYEGFVRRLAPGTAMDADDPATHRVTTRSTLHLPARDIKSTPVLRLPFGALLRIDPDEATCEQGLIAIATGGFVHARHLGPVLHHEAVPFSALAQRIFLGAPYLWGGRTPDGCDCSGLVQSVARLAGHALPRDSGPQEASISSQIALHEHQPEDLIFWPGHVAIAMADDRVIHANAHTFSVAIEPLHAVMARAGAPRSVRRLAQAA